MDRELSGYMIAFWPV